jgi:hypothetical protein
MERAYKTPVNSGIYAKVAWLATSESERQGSLHALGTAEKVANGISWAYQAIKRLGGAQESQLHVNRATLTQ